MISSLITKGGLLLAFMFTLISIPPSVSIYETRKENREIEKAILIEKIEFESNIEKLKKECE
jgi:hypothetical protein